MGNEQKLQELLEKIDSSTRKQSRYALLQLFFTVLTFAAFIVLLLICVRVLPQLQEIVNQAETVLGNLESVTNELANANLTGMVKDIDALVANVDGLVSTSQEGVTEAVGKINAINFEALNDAIKDLSEVIEPIAKFFKSFKFG